MKEGQWLFTIYTGESVGSRFGENSGLVNFGPESRLSTVQIS